MDALQGLVVSDTPPELTLNGDHREDFLGALWGNARDEWLAYLRHRNKRGNTATAYELALKQFFEFFDGAPWDTGSAAAQAWANDMAERGLARTTINQKLSGLWSFFEHIQFTFRRPYTPKAAWLVAEGLLHRTEGELSLWPADRLNPFHPKRIKRHKTTAFGKAEVLTAKEFDAMMRTVNLSATVGKRDFALLFAYFHTCRRAAEILGLRWRDIEPSEDKHFEFRYIYKGGDIRRQKMDVSVYQAIVSYLKAVGRYDSIQDDDYIFTALDPNIGRRGWAKDDYDPEGRPISQVQANNILKKYARRAGIAKRKAHLHALRHGGLRYRLFIMKSQGAVDYAEIQKLAGHSTLAVTEIYVCEVLETMDDPTGEAAAAGLLAFRNKRRRANIETNTRPNDDLYSQIEEAA